MSECFEIIFNIVACIMALPALFVSVYAVAYALLGVK